MTKVFKNAWVVGGAAWVLILASCAQSPSPEPDQAATTPTEYSAVSMTNPDFTPAVGATVRWYDDVFIIDGESALKINDEQKAWLKHTVQAHVEARGYRFVDGDNADYELASALILDNSPAAQRIQSIAHVFPHLGTTVGQHEEGTMIVALKSPWSPSFSSALWRSAIQAYVVDGQTPEAQRARTEALIVRLMDSLPVAGKD